MTKQEFRDAKEQFLSQLKAFAQTVKNNIISGNDWTIKGFIDVSQNIYTISSDTKIVSKILELHTYPLFVNFAKENKYELELAKCQNWYPDMTFISKSNKKIKFAVDLKTTYRNKAGKCNGFTLGSHGEYFKNRTSNKNIQYPYDDYIGHFCFCFIYSRVEPEEFKTYNIKDLVSIQSVAKDFIVFAEEKWKLASDKSGSGNTANIGSIRDISKLLNGDGVFANFGEDLFDDYWINYNQIQMKDNYGKYSKINSLTQFLQYKQTIQQTIIYQNDEKKI